MFPFSPYLSLSVEQRGFNFLSSSSFLARRLVTAVSVTIMCCCPTTPCNGYFATTSALPRIVWVLAWRWFGVALAVAIGLPVACTSLTPALLVVSVLAVLGTSASPRHWAAPHGATCPCWAGGCHWAGSDFGNLASFRFRTISDYIDLPPASHVAFLASSLSTHCCPSGLPGLRQRCPILSGNSSRCWSDQPISCWPQRQAPATW